LPGATQEATQEATREALREREQALRARWRAECPFGDEQEEVRSWTAVTADLESALRRVTTTAWSWSEAECQRHGAGSGRAVDLTHAAALLGDYAERLASVWTTIHRSRGAFWEARRAAHRAQLDHLLNTIAAAEPDLLPAWSAVYGDAVTTDLRVLATAIGTEREVISDVLESGPAAAYQERLKERLAALVHWEEELAAAGVPRA
jgi:hypothetical protein